MSADRDDVKNMIVDTIAEHIVENAADLTPLNPDEQATVNYLFAYHKPEGDQPMRYAAIRASGKAFAEMVLRCCPESADRTVAIRQIQDAVMTANRSIALQGKGRV